MATDKIVAEYTVKVDQALKQLDALAGKVNKLDQETKKTEQGFKDMSSSMVSNLSKVGAAIGVAFGAREIVAFGAETVKLAAQAEGVERAFKRIGGGQYLQGLRDATRGTVTDLVLMQNAVKASNFKIPLENLASLFKFAQARARETGESVDYLVDSIILGIGRKSPLILDNLGISAVELRTRLKGVGVEAANVGDIAKIIGDIATEEMAKMGDQADTTADKIAQIGVAFENMKVAIGKDIIVQFTDLNNEIAKTGQLLNMADFDGFTLIMKALSNVVHAVLEPFTYLNSAIQMNTGAYQLLREVLGLTNGVIDEHIDKQRTVNDLSESEYMTVDRLTNAYKAKQEASTEEIKNVAYYKKAIQDVVDAIENEATAVNMIRPLREKEKQLRAELAKLLGEETKEQKELREQLEKIAKLRLVEYNLMQSTGIPVVQAMSSSIAGLNKMLSEQRKILETSPEFSQQYKDASIAVDELEKKIKNFNDNQIDPSAGYPDISAMGIAQSEIDEVNKIVDGTKEAINTMSDLWSGYYSLISALSAKQTQDELADLNLRLERGEITREKYAEEEKNIRRKEAARNKDAAIFQATISTLQAVINALGSFPFSPANIAISAAVGAAGAAQIAAIASTPLPSFAEGGWVDSKGQIHGRSHKQGGVKIEAEGNEFITKGKYAKPNADILEAINTGNWEKYKFDNIIAPAIDKVLDGGLEGMGASYMLQNQFNDRNLLKAIDRHRTSDKDGFVYLANEISKNMKRQSRWS